MLLRLRQDLKTAIQNKDSNRLSVLRGVIADVTAANKSNQPITTDLHVLSILRKRTQAGLQAAHEFGKSGRQDLQETEEAQVGVLQTYAKRVKVVSDEEIMTRIGEVINDESMRQEGSQKLNRGTVMKRLLGPGGAFEGKPVERQAVAQMVDNALGVS